jgi:hypothetical protein
MKKVKKRVSKTLKECPHEWRAGELEGEVLATCTLCGGWARFDNGDIIDALNNLLKKHTWIARRV